MGFFILNISSFRISYIISISYGFNSFVNGSPLLSIPSTEYVLFTMFLERLSPLILVVATVLATRQVSKVFTNVLSALPKKEIEMTVEKRYLQIVIKIVICLMDILCIGAIVWGIYSGIEMIKFIIKVPELALFLESNL